MSKTVPCPCWPFALIRTLPLIPLWQTLVLVFFVGDNHRPDKEERVVFSIKVVGACEQNKASVSLRRRERREEGAKAAELSPLTIFHQIATKNTLQRQIFDS